jgi:hypothetical protein
MILPSREHKPQAVSMRRHAPNSRLGGEHRQQITGPRCIVFVTGGVTFSEMRSAYEVRVMRMMMMMMMMMMMRRRRRRRRRIMVIMTMSMICTQSSHLRAL